MKRISRAAVTAFCAGSLALGGLAVGMTDAQAAPYNSPSTRQALATSAVLGGVTTAVPVATTTTLPLLGAPLTIDVTSGPGGALTSIAVNPATGLTATTDKPNKVRFVNDGGTAKVEVTSRGGGQNVEAKAGQLTDVAGPGSWSGDVFGTGTATSVQFTTVANADGSPGITGVTSSDATAEIGTVRLRSHDDSQDAVVSIRFTSGIQARTLTIRVGVSTHDDQTRAKVSVSLSRLTDQNTSTTIPDDHGHDGQGSDDHVNGQGGHHGGNDDGANHDAGDDHGTDNTAPSNSTPSSTPSNTGASSTATTVDDHGDDDSTSSTTVNTTSSTTPSSTSNTVDDNGGGKSGSGSHGGHGSDDNGGDDNGGGGGHHG